MHDHLRVFSIISALAAVSCATAAPDVRVGPAVAPVAGTTSSRDAGAAARPDASGNPLRLHVSAHITMAPAQVNVRTRIEPDSRSRLLRVEWWSADGIGGSHEISVDGEHAAPSHYYAIKRMEAGEYLVSAVLMRNDGSEVRRETTVVVVGEGGRFDANTFTGATGALAPVAPRTPW